MRKIVMISLVLICVWSQNVFGQCERKFSVDETFDTNPETRCWVRARLSTGQLSNIGFSGGSVNIPQQFSYAPNPILVLPRMSNLQGTLTYKAFSSSVSSNLAYNGVQLGRVRDTDGNGFVAIQTLVYNRTSQEYTIDLSNRNIPNNVYLAIRMNGTYKRGFILQELSYTSQCPAMPSVIAKAKDITLVLDSAGNATITPGQINDESANECEEIIPTSAITLNKTNFTTDDLGENEVILTAIDATGSLDTDTAIVTVIPSLDRPSNANVVTYLDEFGNADISVSDVLGSAATVGLKYVLEDSLFDCSSSSATANRIFAIKGTDTLKLSINYVVVKDSLGPDVQTQNIEVPINQASGTATITAAMVDNGSTDNCGISSMSLSKTVFSCTDAGENTVVLTVTDSKGNSVEKEAIVTATSIISDDAISSDITTFCPSPSSSQSAVITIDSSVVGVNYFLRNSQTTAIVGSPVAGTGSPIMFNVSGISESTTYHVLASHPGDAMTAACSRILSDEITIGDDIVPVAMGKDTTIVLGAKSRAMISADDIDNGSSDNCTDSLIMELSKSVFTCNDLGENTIVLTVTDSSGNYDTTSVRVTVVSQFSDTPLFADDAMACDGDATLFVPTSIDGVGYKLMREATNTAVTTLEKIGDGDSIKFSVNNVSNPSSYYFEASTIGGKGSLYLNGFNDVITANRPVSFNYNDNYTIETEMTIVPQSNQHNTIFFIGAGNVNDIELYVQRTTRDLTLVHNRSNGGTLGIVKFGSNILPNNTSFHLAITFDGTNATLYLNGAVISTKAIVKPLVTANKKLQFGETENKAIFPLSVQDFRGAFDDFRLWNDVRTPQEIGQNRFVNLEGIEDDLSLYYDFNQSSNTLVKDLVGNNDGAVSGISLGTQHTTTSVLPVRASCVLGRTEAVTIGDSLKPVARAKNLEIVLVDGVAIVAAADINNGSTDNCTAAESLALTLSKSSFDLTNIGQNNVSFVVEDLSGNKDSVAVIITVTEKAGQVITFPTIADVEYGAADFDLTATTTADLPISYRVVSGPATLVSNNSSMSVARTSAVVIDPTPSPSPTTTNNTVRVTGIGTVVIEATQAGNDTVSAASAVQQSFSVNKRSQTITFSTVADVTYGASDFNLAVTTTSGLPISYRIVSGPATLVSNNVIIASAARQSKAIIIAPTPTTTNSRVHITGAGSVVIEATQEGNATIDVATPVRRSFTVNKAAITITADNKSKTYKEALPELTMSFNGFVNNDDESALTALPTISTNAVVNSNVGTYPITLSGGNTSNYTMTLVEGTLTINKATQTISMGSIDDQDVSDTDPIPVSAIASSGLATALTVTGPAKLSVTDQLNKARAGAFVKVIGGQTITLDGTVGTVTLKASQAGNANYEAAEDVTISFEVKDKSNPCLGFEVDVVSTTDVVSGGDGAADITVSGGTKPYSFNWSNNATSEDITGVVGGDYTVEVVDANNCSVTKTLFIGDIITTVSGDAENAGIMLYPNPASDVLSVNIPAKDAQSVSLYILDLKGKVVISGSNINGQIDVSQLPNGLYTVIISTDNRRFSHKVSIIK